MDKGNREIYETKQARTVGEHSVRGLFNRRLKLDQLSQGTKTGHCQLLTEVVGSGVETVGEGLG